MAHFNPKIPLSYILTFSSDHVARALGLDQPSHGRRWLTRFCADKHSSCTLDIADATDLVAAVDQLLRRYHEARASTLERSIVYALKGLFCLFRDAIECRVELDADCNCSWDRRIGDCEALASFPINIAKAYWSTGYEPAWMGKSIETLACEVTEVVERDGLIARCADDDPSVEARTDRLAVFLFDAVNDLHCGNWAHEDWMTAVPRD